MLLVLGAILLQRRETSKTSFISANFKVHLVLTWVRKALWAYLCISHIRGLPKERKQMAAVGQHNLQGDKQYIIMPTRDNKTEESTGGGPERCPENS